MGVKIEKGSSPKELKMSNYSEFLKSQKEKDLKFFFGENVKKISNKYFKYESVKNDDEIILITNDIKFLKGNYVLIVDNNKAIYLKDWQVKQVHNYNLGLNAYAVKLNRKFFNPYQFKFTFDEFSFDKEETFDDLLDIARTQKNVIALGWAN